MIWIICGFALVAMGAFNFWFHRKAYPKLALIVAVFCGALGVWYISIGTSLITGGS